MGLAISKELVELMGGRIGHKANKAKGSTFWFTVRCVLGDTSQGREQGSDEKLYADYDREIARKLRILVAEDNVINQEITAAFLKRDGHDVDIVANGLEAVRNVQACAYDVILMEIHMPEMDGIAATMEIRNLPGDVAKTPIIAVTANAMAGDREKFMEFGMNGYASKPFKSEELFSAIRRCLRDDALSDFPKRAAP